MSNSDGLQKKRVFLSSALAIASFALNVIFGFWSSPFIVSKLGAEAYGFSTLGGNITTYMSLVTVAINSFAARYITIALQQKDTEKANRYFTSVFYANLMIAAVMLIPSAVVVWKLQSFFAVPPSLTVDVQFQWGLLFAGWIADLVFKVFSTATFAKNRLDINHGLTALSNLLRFVVILILFLGFDAHLWYIGVAAVICAVFVDVGYFISQRRLMPEVRIRRRYFDWKSLGELMVKGVWNSINQLSSLLINGCNLMITNWVVNAQMMGFYSVAQTIPTYLQSLMYTICDVFNPNLTICYANGRNDQVRDGLKFSIKFNSLLLLVPLMGFFVYGVDFYRLWQYSLGEQEINTVFHLSSLVILPMISSVFVQPLLTVNTITARLKVPVFVNLIIGVSNIILVLVLTSVTDWGVFAIAGVSSVLILLRNYCFYPIYSAQNLQLPIGTFYPILLRGTATGAVVFCFLYITHLFLHITCWMQLLLYAVIFGLFAEVLVFLLMLDRDDKRQVWNVLKTKVLRR